MKRQRGFILFIGVIVLAALACNLGGGDVDATATAEAEATEMFNAALTAAVEAAASDTPLATEAPPEVDTPTPSVTPTVTATEILNPFITTDVNSNVRNGPSTVYDIHGVLLKGQTANILGRNSNSSWWVIEFAAAPTGKGWIADSIVAVSGDTSNVPLVAAPPTPTPAPSGDWDGTWITNCSPFDCGEMILVQNNNTVTGTYADGEGSVSGTVDDNHLKGTWSRGTESGTIDFWLTNNAKRWRGNFDKTAPWCGHREGSSDPSPCGVASWYGSWTTDCEGSSCGTMTLTQNGANVSGTYGGGDREIDANVDGTELTGNWEWGASSGSIHFFMLSNGDQFNGNYDGSFYWCGYRSGAGYPGTCMAP